MKVWNYMIIMLTMMVFLTFVGLAPSGTQNILQTVGININQTTSELISGDVVNSNWFDILFNGLTGLIVVAGFSTAIIVGLFTRQFEWKLVLVGFFTGFVVLFVSFGWSIVQLARTTGENWLTAVAATIFLPLTVMFVFSIVEWFGGSPAD